MELLTLDSNYQPSELVERYNSLVWTERYSQTGDFQLVSNDVERMLNLLPLESVVTLRESTVPMIVEAHKIQKSITGAPVLTTTGRSFESVLERRAVALTLLGYGPLEPWIVGNDKPSDTAYYIMRKIIGDPVERHEFYPAVEPFLSPKDAMPMLDFPAPADWSIGSTNPYEIKSGNLYSAVMELLSLNHHGLKAVRPVLGSSKIAIEIYNGADLTNQVAFDAKFDQFEDATYLLSYAGLTNVGYVYSKTDSQEVLKNQAVLPEDEPEGLERRVLLVDVSSEESADTPEGRDTRGLIELYKNNATALFDGQIAEQVAAGYNSDYFLGDIIRLDGEYGLSRNVRVAEFIRTDDSTGNKAYPTFEMVSE